jgi:glycosyltransferase involved in cell wall biosynthesis
MAGSTVNEDGVVMARPRISIVLPVFNGEQYIERCVDSILGQTCQDFELILLDDGSTDGSATVLRRCAERAPEKVRVYSHPNMGVARSRNRGMELAAGEYLCFVDVDDRLDPDFCAVCLAAMERDGADVVVGGYRRVVDGRVPFTFVAGPGSPYAKYVASAVWGKLHRRSFVVANQITFPEVSFGEDLLFTVQEYACADRVQVVPYVGYSYIANGASISQVYMRGLAVRERELADLVTRLATTVVPDAEADAYDYFVTKTVVFLLLHFGRTDTPSVFRRAARDLFGIVGRYRPSALRLGLLLTGPRGERVSTRFVVALFVALRQVHASGVFTWLYCRGRRQTARGRADRVRLRPGLHGPHEGEAVPGAPGRQRRQQVPRTALMATADISDR